MFVLDVKDLTYKYEDGTLALDNISLQIEKGETVAVLGQNGSGKTTLLFAISGVFGPLQQVNLFLSNESSHNNFVNIGFLFANPEDQLFSLTVKDEIAFALINLGLNHEEIQKKVYAISAKLRIDNLLNKEIMKISFGQKRKVAMASILVYEPQLLLLDEPTFGLDPNGVDDFVEMLTDLKSQGKTIIVATNDIDFAKEVTTKAIILSKEHKLIAYDETAKLLSDKQLLYTHNLIRRKFYM